MRSKRVIIFSFIYILTVVIISALAIETALRILATFPKDSTYFKNDTKLYFTGQPNLKGDAGGPSTNSYGFFDKEHNKNKEKPRLIFIGDSFIAAMTENARKFNLVTQVGDMFRQQNIDVETLNLGLPGAGPHDYLAILENYAVELDPDIVCVFFFVGNDIFQGSKDFRTKIWLELPRPSLNKPYIVGKSLEYSYLYRFIRYSIRKHYERVTPHHLGTFSKKTFLSIERQRLAVCRRIPSAFMKECYENSIELINRMYLITKEKNILFMLILIPDEYQINKNLQRELLRQYNLKASDYDLKKPQEILIRNLSKEINTIDVMPYLEDSKEQLYFVQDTHLNQKGHFKVAEVIFLHINKFFGDLGDR